MPDSGGLGRSSERWFGGCEAEVNDSMDLLSLAAPLSSAAAVAGALGGGTTPNPGMI